MVLCCRPTLLSAHHFAVHCKILSKHFIVVMSIFKIAVNFQVVYFATSNAARHNSVRIGSQVHIMQYYAITLKYYTI